MHGISSKEYRKQGQLDKAISYCLDNLKYKPGDAQLQLELSKAKLAQGKIDEAKEAFKMVKKLYRNIEPEFLYYEDFKKYEAELAVQ